MESLRRTPRDEQAAVVRAEIERGICRTATIALQATPRISDALPFSDVGDHPSPYVRDWQTSFCSPCGDIVNQSLWPANSPRSVITPASQWVGRYTSSYGICYKPVSSCGSSMPYGLGDSLTVKLTALDRAILVRIQVPQPATPAKQSLRRMARPSHGKQDLFRGQSQCRAPERGSISSNWRASRRVVSASAMQG